jgi:hypothetical protein
MLKRQCARTGRRAVCELDAAERPVFNESCPCAPEKSAENRKQAFAYVSQTIQLSRVQRGSLIQNQKEFKINEGCSLASCCLGPLNSLSVSRPNRQAVAIFYQGLRCEATTHARTPLTLRPAANTSRAMMSSKQCCTATFCKETCRSESLITAGLLFSSCGLVDGSFCSQRQRLGAPRGVGHRKSSM